MFQVEWMKMEDSANNNKRFFNDGSEQLYIPTNKIRERHTFVEDSSSFVFKQKRLSAPFVTQLNLN